MNIKVSIPTFNEITDELAKAGYKLGENINSVTLTKNEQLVRPVDMRLATIRRDCLIEAIKVGEGNLFDIAETMYDYVVYGKKPEKEEPK